MYSKSFGPLGASPLRMEGSRVGFYSWVQVVMRPTVPAVPLCFLLSEGTCENTQCLK